MSVRSEIIETVNKLFIYIDDRQWDKLCKEVFTPKVYLDMSSLGGDKTTKSCEEICQMWEEGFSDIDEVNHLAGNYIVETERNEATVFAYATAAHFKASATKGTTREFVGSYDLHMTLKANGWRIDKMKYNLRFMSGNQSLI